MLKCKILLLSIFLGTNCFAAIVKKKNMKCDKSGLEIINQQKSQNSIKYEYFEQKMTLFDYSSKITEVRELKQHIDSSKNKEQKSIITFMKPTDVKGTALLNWESATRENDQWLYLPALRKLQRIASSGRHGYFMGTDFTYADLTPETTKDFTYNCTSMKKCSSKTVKKCYYIEAVPKNKDIERKTGYSKRILKVKKEDLTTQKITYFDRKSKKAKVLINSDWKKHGTAYRPMKSVMKRGTIHKTTIETKKIEIDKVIPEVTFSHRYILKNMHTR